MTVRVKKVCTPIVRRVTATKKPVVHIDASKKKVTFSRRDLGDGCFLMNYYFRKGPMGEFIAEDIESATHYERAVYDRYGNLLGSSIARLGGDIFW